eukprot:m.238602 g.238602  ORF g.238602 m.238602 type:complete len:102 (+) comp19391_c0_seq1:534-839(+)
MAFRVAEDNGMTAVTKMMIRTTRSTLTRGTRKKRQAVVVLMIVTTASRPSTPNGATIAAMMESSYILNLGHHTKKTGKCADTLSSYLHLHSNRRVLATCGA